MMAHIIVLLMDLTLIVFAVYGTFVFWKWHKLEKKADAMLDELRREMEQEGDNGERGLRGLRERV